MPLLIVGLPNDQDNGFGGGLEVFSSCADGCFVDGNTFTGNLNPKGDGGGFYAAAPASMIISNNIFEDNSAGEDHHDVTSDVHDVQLRLCELCLQVHQDLQTHLDCR